MKTLMNLAIASGLFTEGFKSDYGAVQRFVRQHDLDGIEMILYGDYKVEAIPKSLVVGHHLLYWPNWIDFWQENEEALIEAFLSEENIKAYYGFRRPKDMVAYYNYEFQVAKTVEADYMVFHVSNASFEDIFTYDHRYESRQVMATAIDLINRVFVGDGPMLLFENLMWPGLTYTDPVLTKWFFQQITYKNKGLLLDISHLMATNSDVTTEEEGIAYIHKILDSMGDMITYIKGIHLNKTLAGAYLQEDHSVKHKRYVSATDMMERYGIIHDHISKIDSHMPFDDPGVMSIINRVQPDYLVYELTARSTDELSERIRLQNQVLRF